MFLQIIGQVDLQGHYWQKWSKNKEGLSFLICGTFYIHLFQDNQRSAEATCSTMLAILVCHWTVGRQHPLSTFVATLLCGACVKLHVQPSNVCASKQATSVVLTVICAVQYARIGKYNCVQGHGFVINTYVMKQCCLFNKCINSQPCSMSSRYPLLKNAK